MRSFIKVDPSASKLLVDSRYHTYNFQITVTLLCGKSTFLYSTQAVTIIYIVLAARGTAAVAARSLRFAEHMTFDSTARRPDIWPSAVAGGGGRPGGCCIGVGAGTRALVTGRPPRHPAAAMAEHLTTPVIRNGIGRAGRRAAGADGAADRPPPRSQTMTDD